MITLLAMAALLPQVSEDIDPRPSAESKSEALVKSLKGKALVERLSLLEKQLKRTPDNRAAAFEIALLQYRAKSSLSPTELKSLAGILTSNPYSLGTVTPQTPREKRIAFLLSPLSSASDVIGEVERAFPRDMEVIRCILIADVLNPNGDRVRAKRNVEKLLTASPSDEQALTYQALLRLEPEKYGSKSPIEDLTGAIRFIDQKMAGKPVAPAVRARVEEARARLKGT